MTKSKIRIQETHEVFTPNYFVNQMLAKLPEDFKLPGKTVLDNSCGNGQFLAEVFIQKSLNYSNIRDIKHDIYGVDLMVDNVADSVARLAVLEEYGIDIVDENAKFLINHPEYHDGHSYAWLKDNYSVFERRYWGTLDDTDIDVVITFEYFDDGDAGVLRYTFADGTTEVNPNIVCQDALKYNYCFSKVKKQVLKFE